VLLVPCPTFPLLFHHLLAPGRIVRRGLLFLDDCEVAAHAFALRLALRYVEKEGIRPIPDCANPEHIRLGPYNVKPPGI
jgi:CHASE2 domain-containing sensor protein